MLDEAYSRWLRPNEIHALLCNHKFFTINVKPVNLPKSNQFFYRSFSSSGLDYYLLGTS